MTKYDYSKKGTLSFGIDWDDVLSPLNERAVEMYNERNADHITIETVTDWEKGKYLFKDIYTDTELYKRQYTTKEAKEFIKKLQNIGNVFIISSCFPKFSRLRFEQIRSTFPDISTDNILIVSDKSIYRFTYLLDDAPHNIIENTSDFPVLYCQPWNKSIRKDVRFSVKSFEEFLELVLKTRHHIKEST